MKIAPSMGEKAESSLDALEKANQYSHRTKGVGILMSYGKSNDVSAGDIGIAFVEALKKRDIASRYFYYTTDRKGMAIEFHIGYSALGPWNVNQAAAQIEKVIDQANAMKRVHKLGAN